MTRFEIGKFHKRQKFPNCEEVLGQMKTILLHTEVITFQISQLKSMDKVEFFTFYKIISRDINMF
jgi:hypothetical protein